MIANVAYPFAFTIATMVAISSARRNGDWFYSEMDLGTPLLLAVLVLTLLAVASFTIGVLIPRSAIIAGMEGITVTP